MESAFFLHLALHGLCELAAALVIAFWVSQGWEQSPPPFPVNWVKNPFRAALMVVFGIGPALLSLLLYPLFRQFHHPSRDAAEALIAISYILSVIYGALVGLAASCCVAPADPQREFRPAVSAAVSTVMILAYLVLGWLLRAQFFFHALAAMVAPLLILFTARSIVVTSASPQAEPNAVPPPVQRNLWPAIGIAFLPSALFLIAFAVAFNTNLGKDTSNALLWLASAVSVVCCFTASIMLFKRSTAGTITGGILFLLLNGFIAFFFGCCASLNGGNFR